MSGCPPQGPRPESLHFTRSGSLARTMLGGTELSGTIYDTWDFSLNGQTLDGSRYSLRGRAGLSSTSDAGTGLRLSGSLRTSAAAKPATGIAAGSSTNEGCELEERFTATKH